MKIAFLSNKLTLRGTEVCLYDYADCNETLLGNTSIIITRPFSVVKQCSPRDVHPEAYAKFQNRFPMEYYTNPSDLPEIVSRNNIDIVFIEKAGSPEDGLVLDGCKTIIHCVFTTQCPHGTIYTAISDFLNKTMNTEYPVLPYMVRVHDTQENFRKEFQIPDDAIVFGSYSGADEYTIDYVKQVVCDVATNPAFKHIYFIYLNIDAFGPTCENIKFFPGTADMAYKRKFINTCDAMLYGRTGGETFGLACGEFSICSKPVIARPDEPGRSHEDILGDAMIKCSTYSELYTIVTNWKDYTKDVSNNGYFQYTPEKVMERFKTQVQSISIPAPPMNRKDLVRSIVSNIKNGVFVEIGTFMGDFADHILASSENSTLYCIDPYISYSAYSGDSTNNETGDKVFLEVRARLQNKYGDRVIFIRDFSDDVIDRIPDDIDFLYIDGNHSYKYVYNDLKNYYKKVKPNHYIVGDDAVDTDETKRDSNGDVYIQWNGGAYGHYGVVKAFNQYIKEKNISGTIIGNQYCIQKPRLDINYIRMNDRILFKERKRITIVTAFFNIQRASWQTSSRTTMHYLESFKEYLKLDYNIVVFLDDSMITPEFISLIAGKNVTLIPITMEWLMANTEAWKGLDTAKNITNSEYYKNLTKHRANDERTQGEPQNIHPEYCIINHTKIDFIHYAIQHKCIPEGDFICWSDFGYHASILHMNPAEMPSNALDCERFNTKKLCFFLRNSLAEQDMDPVRTLTHPRETFTGSFWGGPAELMLRLHTLYHACLKEMYELQISDFDQHVYVRCFLKQPELFELYVSDGKWPQALTDFQLP